MEGTNQESDSESKNTIKERMVGKREKRDRRGKGERAGGGRGEEREGSVYSISNIF